MSDSIDSVDCVNANGKKALKELLLYKADRTLAIAGLIVLGVVALALGIKEIAMACAGALAAYVGGRVAK